MPVALVLLAVAAAGYHYLQSRGRVMPWIFPDEMRYVELARAAAESGVPEVRADRPLGGALTSYLMAPAWLIDDTATAWEAVKATNAALFSLTVVPVYLLARRLAGTAASLLAAAASVALPAGVFTATHMQEPVAIPVCATAALLTARLVERPSWRTAGGLALTVAAGAAVRGQLAIIPGAVAVALVAVAVAGPARSRRRTLLAAGAGCAVLVPAALAVVAVQGSSTVTDGIRGMTDDPVAFLGVANASAVAAAVAVWVLPAVALLAALSWLRGDDRPRAAFAATAAGFITVFVLYTGFKAAALGYPPITLIEERNLVYLEPVALVALAAVPGRVGVRAALIAGGVVALGLVRAPLAGMAIGDVLTETPGTSWMAAVVEPGDARSRLLPLFLGLAALGAAAAARRSAGLPALAAVTAAVAVCGGLIHRADREVSRATEAATATAAPQRDWVDARVGGRTAAVLLVPEMADLRAVWGLAFWNRSVRLYSSLDGKDAGLPGLLPGVADDGQLGLPDGTPVVHRIEYALEGDSVEGPAPGMRLSFPPGAPRLATSVTGRYADGWVGESFIARRYGNGAAGALVVQVDATNPFIAAPRTVTGRVDGTGGASVAGRVRPGGRSVLRVPVPAGPFTARFAVSPVASPADQGLPDARRLGVVLAGVEFPGSAGDEGGGEPRG